MPTFFGMAALYRAAPRLASRRPRPGAGVPKPITSTLVVTTAAAPLAGVGSARACLAALQGDQAGAHPSPINATLNNLSRPCTTAAHPKPRPHRRIEAVPDRRSHMVVRLKGQLEAVVKLPLHGEYRV